MDTKALTSRTNFATCARFNRCYLACTCPQLTGFLCQLSAVLLASQNLADRLVSKELTARFYTVLPVVSLLLCIPLGGARFAQGCFFRFATKASLLHFLRLALRSIFGHSFCFSFGRCLWLRTFRRGTWLRSCCFPRSFCRTGLRMS